MIFSEKKENNSFVYKTVDVFGEMEFISPTKLKPELLDQIFLAIFNIKSNTETIEGEIAGTGISYKFKKAKQWDKLDEEEEIKDYMENTDYNKYDFDNVFKILFVILLCFISIALSLGVIFNKF